MTSPFSSTKTNWHSVLGLGERAGGGGDGEGSPLARVALGRHLDCLVMIRHDLKVWKGMWFGCQKLE